MAKTEISKPADTSVSRPRDIFAAMRDEMDRVLERFETDWPRWPGPSAWPRWPSAFRRATGTEMVVPSLDVRENAKSIVIEAELPGVEEKNVSVTLANGLLTIKGEKKDQHEEKGETHYFSERSFGAFERCLQLPDTIDETKVDATFNKGVLKITAAKKPEAVKAERKIEIGKS
jgi:HSP20 family protein